MSPNARRQPGLHAYRRPVAVLRLAFFGLVSLLASLFLSAWPNPAPQVVQAANSSPEAAAKAFRYVEATGHSLIAPVLRFYTRSGGEERHGKPLSELLYAKGHYQQYFERSLIEFYPAYNGSGEEVRLVPLGQQVAQEANLDLQPSAPFAGTPDHWYFPETGHGLKGAFLEFWRNAGEPSNLGQPISDEMSESAPDGSRLSVQYFENVRLQRPETSEKSFDTTISNLGTFQAQQKLKPAQLAPIPLSRFQAPRTVKIPSLMFHYTRLVDQKRDPLGYALSIKPDTYLQFLDWVQTNGYNTVTISQILDYLKYGILLPDKAVNFRWDDGHDNNWWVYQEMKKRGMTATFFVISHRLELLPAQWQQIDRDGFEVTAHTRTHPDLKGVRDLANEITGSKNDLEAMLGHPVRTFAYPYGKYGPAIKQVTRDSGFEMAVSTDGGYNFNLDDMFQQPVISVTGGDNVESFAAKITRAVPNRPSPGPTPTDPKTATPTTPLVVPTVTPRSASKTRPNSLTPGLTKTSLSAE